MLSPVLTWLAKCFSFDKNSVHIQIIIIWNGILSLNWHMQFHRMAFIIVGRQASNGRYLSGISTGARVQA